MAEVLAVLIFIVMFVLIITDKIERHIVTLVSGLVMIVVVFGILMRNANAIWETLNLGNMATTEFWYSAGETAESSGGINWATIIFIFGMMVMVEGMARAGFFEWLCIKLAKMVKFKTIPLLITFMVMSFVLAMFIDSITVILFLAAVTVELAKTLKFDPIPMILSEIFCANLGGSSTMCGDPPNIIIGTSLGYTFFDFVTNTGLIAIISLAVVVLYFYLVFRKELRGGETISVDTKTLEEKGKIKNKTEFAYSVGIFFIAVALLVTHSMTGLTVAFIGVFIAALTLLTAYKNVLAILKKVDYKTLLFFIGLFIVVGGLEESGLLVVIASFIGRISGGNIMLMIAIIIWVSAIASAFVDNIPFSATMIPIISSLAATSGVNLTSLAWALSIGTDIGGSATPIGASANVVGTSVAEKEGYPVGWGRYCKKVAPAAAIVCAIGMLIMFLRYC